MLSLLIFLRFVVFVLTDTPANCSYDDIEGEWSIKMHLPISSKDVNCTNLDHFDPYTSTIHLRLDYPNVVEDSYGNTGTWTMIYNQGFEIILLGRSYFMFSDYLVSGNTVQSLCGRASLGWSHLENNENWACITARKQQQPTTKFHEIQIESKELNEIHGNNIELIDFVNDGNFGWKASKYDLYDKLTRHEMRRRMGGSASKVYTYNYSLMRRNCTGLCRILRNIRRAKLPKHWDWRNVDGVNYVTPVRDQKSCGSCYAFASMGMLESRNLILTGGQQQVIFSPQDIVSCSNYSQGCSGGFPYLIAGKYATDFGIVEEKCNPYIGDDTQTCNTRPCKRQYTYRYGYVGGYFGASSELLMMETLVREGPLAVGFEVYNDFLHYKHGIYRHLSQTHRFGFNPLELTNHAVLLVGYGEDAGIPYWIVKNFWSRAWGEDGYFRILRGVDMCGFESMAVNVELSPN